MTDDQPLVMDDSVPFADSLRLSEGWLRFIEPAVIVTLIVVAVATAFVVRGAPQSALLSPLMVTALLVANLLPAMALIVLAGRRFARRRARRASGGEARLHTRLVALFSVTAATPTLLVAIFASFVFQSGMDFWFSAKSRGMFESAVSVAQNYLESERRDVGANGIAMATDLRRELSRTSIDSPRFFDFYVQQVVVRELSESAIIELGRDGVPRTLALIDPDNRAAETRLPAATIQRLRNGEVQVATDTPDGIEAVVRLVPERQVYLHVGRGSSVLGINLVRTSRRIFADYNALLNRSQALQFRFVAALYLGSLLLLGMAVAAAILIADRIVAPIDDLVKASSRVAAGDLEVRVKTPPRSGDEITRLAMSFNRMTERLGEQTRDLLDANMQIENRRAFIEAVLSAVGSGVLSVNENGQVRLVNAAASRMLRREEADILGAQLAEVAPELQLWLDEGMPDPILTLDLANESRIWTLKAIAGEHGHVLTFEDITQQLYDQRRAAWSDVARRIAHEIKNPLTPIQLAAERLQRRFATQVGEGAETFGKLTSTIVRQVGDLRRMVDEFSDFARMPKPLFRQENLSDIMRQTVFLHEVAHPDIRFVTSVPDAPALLTCDRRLIAQAATNVVKNAVEAIAARAADDGTVNVAVREGEGELIVTVADNGAGLPADRDSIAEPYVTAREGGTGLGLAIVKKIVEEHGGLLTFDDAAGGGTVVTITLPVIHVHTGPLADTPAGDTDNHERV